MEIYLKDLYKKFLRMVPHHQYLKKVKPTECGLQLTMLMVEGLILLFEMANQKSRDKKDKVKRVKIICLIKARLTTRCSRVRKHASCVAQLVTLYILSCFVFSDRLSFDVRRAVQRSTINNQKRYNTDKHNNTISGKEDADKV